MSEMPRKQENQKNQEKQKKSKKPKNLEKINTKVELIDKNTQEEIKIEDQSPCKKPILKKKKKKRGKKKQAQTTDKLKEAKEEEVSSDVKIQRIGEK